METHLAEEQTKAFRAFLKLVETMRQAQKDYFASKKRHDYNSSQKYLGRSLALESRVDKEIPRLFEEIQTSFQPELFK